MIVSLIAALLLGLVAGYIAKALVPGKDPGGPLVTIGIGLLGSLIGYFLFRLLHIGDADKFDWGGIIGAIIGSVIVLLVYRKAIGPGREPARVGR
ncbi:MAG TPA: GlsB/YeaQ/YmgE family stress response membrane protein [Solirubrobacteraceae bacterium]|jgi:uncharacterized membrane protein YeaQ/YmgE (transglycosylase-associated protein family)